MNKFHYQYLEKENIKNYYNLNYFIIISSSK